MCLPAAAIPFIIAGAGAAAGGVAQGVGSANAGASMKEGAEKAADVQREYMRQQQHNYEQSRADMAPWLDSGRSSLGELLRQMQAGDFETPYTQFDPSQLANDPGYQFRMSEGQKALERSASARGLMNSGGALKSLARYSQGVASDEYGNAWNRHQSEYATRQGANMNRYNRLANMAGLGQATAHQMGGMAGQYNAQLGQGAGQLGNLQAAMSNADASMAMGFGNAVSNTFNSLGGLGGYLSQGQSIPTQDQNPNFFARPWRG